MKSSKIGNLIGSAQSMAGKTSVRNAAIYTVGSMLPQFINVLLLPLFTRYLSASEYGILSYTTALCAFLFVLGTLSIHAYVLRHYFECKTDLERSNLFGNIAVFLVIYNLVLLSIEFLVFPRLFQVLDIQIPFEPFMKIALINCFIDILAVLPQVYFRIRQEALRFTMLTVSSVLLSTGFSFYLVVYAKMGILGRYYGLLGANTIMVVVYLLIIFRISSFSFDTRLLKNALKFSLPLIPTAILYNLTTMSDRFILERYISLSQMGIYAVGLSIANGLSFFNHGIYKAIEPEVFKMADRPDFHDRILKFKKYTTLILLAVSCSLIILSKEVVMLLIDPKFYESYKIIMFITMALCFQGIAIPFNCYLIATYQTRHMPAISAAGAISSILINFALVPRIGMYGAAISVIASSLITLLAYKFVTEHTSDIRWNLNSDLLLVIGAFIVSILIVQVDTPAIILTVVIKLTLFFALALLLFWHSKDNLFKAA